MTRFYLKFSLVLLGLLIAPTFLIHAQPYDDHELRELLMPEGCPMPCFMGIRPGVTTVDEAAKLLKASGWVKDVDLLPSRELVWTWNGLQPSVLDGEVPGHLMAPDKIVTNIQVLLTTPMIEIWWASEQPSLILSTYDAWVSHKQYYYFWYPYRGITLQIARQACTTPIAALTAKGGLLYFYSVAYSESIVADWKRNSSFTEIPVHEINSTRIC